METRVGTALTMEKLCPSLLPAGVARAIPSLAVVSNSFGAESLRPRGGLRLWLDWVNALLLFCLLGGVDPALCAFVHSPGRRKPILCAIFVVHFNNQ